MRKHESSRESSEDFKINAVEERHLRVEIASAEGIPGKLT
jgi:hypothetical protein